MPKMVRFDDNGNGWVTYKDYEKEYKTIKKEMRKSSVKDKIIDWIKNKSLIYILAALLVFWCAWMINETEKYTDHEYSLTEIQDGIYGIYATMSSAAPGLNYEMVTVCINGSIYTLKGDVDITFTDGEPKMFYRNYNRSHGDEMHLYVPRDSIQYQIGSVITR